MSIMQRALSIAVLSCVSACLHVYAFVYDTVITRIQADLSIMIIHSALDPLAELRNFSS